MILAADYPFLDIVGTMLVFFLWGVWFWCLTIVVIDVFRREDFSGWAKAAWTAFLIIVPWLGLLVYLIAHGKGMGERRMAEATTRQAMVNNHIRQVAQADGGTTEEIAKAKRLLDSGAIDAIEYDQLKAKALAA
jgi:hypothetical protein